MSLTWEQPPSSSHGPGSAGMGVQQRLAREIAERPGEWALMLTGVGVDVANSAGRRLRRGVIEPENPYGKFEAVTRKQDDGTYNLWAKFIGGE